MRLTADYPPVWTALFTLAAWTAGRLLPMRAPGALGWVLVAAGVLLMAAAAWRMRAAHTTLNPHGAPSALVTDGVFRLSRNPIYLGDLLVLAGLALVFRAPLALALVPVLGALLTARFIRPEEARLAAAFPDAFAAWAQRTRRWL